MDCKRDIINPKKDEIMNENKVNKEYEYSILIGYDSEGNCYEY